MPIWDYRCANDECPHIVLDLFMSPGGEVPTHCGQKMVRMIAAPSFVVKGFSSANGYSGGQTYEIKSKEKGMRVVVKS